MEPVYSQNMQLSDVMGFIDGSETPSKKLHSSKSDKQNSDSGTWIARESSNKDGQNPTTSESYGGFKKKSVVKKIIEGHQTCEEVNFRNSTLTESRD